jgi:hypothetical protein
MWVKNGIEKVTLASAAAGTINYDFLTQSVLYCTPNATGNWTLNIRGSASTSANTVLAIGEAITVVLMNTNGATAYYQTVLQIDGATITPTWQGGTAPTSGNANAIDIYTITIVKTANATFKALAAQVTWK